MAFGPESSIYFRDAGKGEKIPDGLLTQRMPNVLPVWHMLFACQCVTVMPFSWSYSQS